jgi:hypothetical protein
LSAERSLNAEVMEVRDRAPPRKDYRCLRNVVSSMVKRDKMRTNLEKRRKADNGLKMLWRLAKSALGKPQSLLPASLVVDGCATVGNAGAAKAMNDFYIAKVYKLRADLRPVPAPPSNWPKTTAPFVFLFANAGKIARTIAALKNTDALGLDGIPVSVLKKGVEVLASPIAHLVNRSLASGVVPNGFKIGCVIPIHKGKGESVSDPASSSRIWKGTWPQWMGCRIHNSATVRGDLPRPQLQPHTLSGSGASRRAMWWASLPLT